MFCMVLTVVLIEIITQHQAGQIALRVGIHRRVSLPLFCQHPPHVVCGRCFADTAFVIEECHSLTHSFLPFVTDALWRFNLTYLQVLNSGISDHGLPSQVGSQ